MSRTRVRPGLARLAVLVVVAAVASAVLVIGRSGREVAPTVGSVADQDYVADRTIEVEDLVATDEARDGAAAAVEDVYQFDPDVEQVVRSRIEGFFKAASLAEFHDRFSPTATTTTTTSTTTTTTTTTTTAVAGEEPAATTTTVPPATTTSTTTTTIPVPTREELATALESEYSILAPETRSTFVVVAFGDLQRVEEGQTLILPAVENAAVAQASAELRPPGITREDLSAVQQELLAQPPLQTNLPDFPERRDVETAIADLVAKFLQPNNTFDQEATDEARQAARDAVTPVTRTFLPEETIASKGEVVGAVQAQAIEDMLARTGSDTERLAALAVVAVTVALVGAYLRRTRFAFWAEPKLVVLFGILVVLLAVAARLAASLTPADSPVLAYLLPAASFGFLAGILFEPRVAVLLAVPTGVFTALATGDAGLSIYAAASVLAPLPFVSAVSSRRDLRVAVLYTAALLAPLAGAVAWFFLGSEQALRAAGYGVISGLVSGVVGIGALPFLDNVFGITTSLTLLDLTDRNHSALRLLEERAPGTFNHSILVGTLAGRAARAIGANPLLAEAAAYYHDLGKAENPQMFIENQFGGSNPHNWMRPEESAAVVRNHVTDGLRLARAYKIPPDVAEGIRQHHGTSLMRYFYHKALDEYGEVANADDFRHVGRKPQRKEMAILMLSDAVEAAARSMAYQEQPSVEGLSKVVDQVVAEKVEDGQLDECALTFGELTRVKQALLDALVSHYHHRVAYPNFPGSAARA